MKKITVVIANPTEPISLGMNSFGGKVCAAYDRELQDRKTHFIDLKMLDALKRVSQAYEDLLQSDYATTRNPEPGSNDADLVLARAVIAQADAALLGRVL